MNDLGRMRVCDEIAKKYPYSTQVVYEVYELVRKDATEKKIVITLTEQINNTESVLNIAHLLDIEPVRMYHKIKAEKT